MRALERFRALEPDMTAQEDYVAFIRQCPSRRATEYTKALISTSVGKNNPVSWIIHLLRAGKALRTAKNRAEKKLDDGVEKPWALPSREECEAYDPSLEERYPHYDPQEGMLANFRRLQDADA